MSGKIRCAILCLMCLGCISEYAVASRQSNDDNLIERPCKNMIVINSYNENAPWVQAYITPFMIEAARRKNLQCQMVHLSSTLITNDSVFEKVQDGIFERFHNNKPEYLVIIGKMGFAMRDRIKKEWGDIPIILMSTNDEICERRYLFSGENTGADTASYMPLSELRHTYNFTFVEIPEYYEQTIDLMLRMQPKMRKLVYVSDMLANNVRQNRQIQEYIDRKHHGLEYEWLQVSEETSDSIQSYLMSDDMEIGLLLSSMYYSRKSAFGYPILVTDDIRLVAATLHPVFTLKQGYMEYGAVGGFFPDQAYLQDRTLNIFKKMLSGVSMKDIPFVYSDISYPMMDYKLAVDAGLDMRLCPEDTVVVNKPLSVWERYFWHICFTVIVVAAIIVVLIVLIVQQRRRMQLMAARQRTVDNMPVAYLLAKVKRDATGVTGYEIKMSNPAVDELAVECAADGTRDTLFDRDFMLKQLDYLYEKRDICVRFSYHFEHCDAYYDFFACETAGEDEIEFFGIDVSERKKQEEDLIEAREAAKESDRLKSAFLANMSHEIRTPLNAIVGFSNMLADCDNEEERREFIQIINTNNDQLLTLINDILDLSAVESNRYNFKYQPTDVNELIEGLKASLKIRMPEGVVLNSAIGAAECVVNTDPARLSQVLTNLLTNAAKFTVKGSVIFGYELSGDNLYFFVRDTGRGLSKENRELVFQRFVKLDEFAKGIGLGLAICRTLVEKMGGEIGVDSKGEGQGCTFWFTLPYKKV